MEGYKAVLTRYFSLWVAEYDVFYKLVDNSGFVTDFGSKRPLDITVYIETIVIANSRQIVKLQTLYTEMINKFGYSKTASHFLKNKYKQKVKGYHKFYNQALIMKIENKPQTNSFINQHKHNLLLLLKNQQKK